MTPVAPTETVLSFDESGFLNVTVSRHRTGLASIVRIEGDLEADTVTTLRQHLQPLLRRAGATVVLDLARLRFLSSAGMVAFIEARATQAACRGRCLFVNVPPAIRRIFYVMDVIPIDTIFATMGDVDRHLEALQRGDVAETQAVGDVARTTVR